MTDPARSADVILDRTLITGPICDTMPDIVVVEIMRSRGIPMEYPCSDSQRSEAVLMYSRTPQIIARRPFPKDGYARLARYVNDDYRIKWNVKNLEECYNRLTNIPAIPSVSLLDDCGMSNLGNPTPDQPKRICGCVLYYWCVNLGIFTDKSYTLADMYGECRRIVSDTGMMQSMIMDDLSIQSPDSLSVVLSLLNQLSLGKDRPQITADQLESSWSVLKHINDLNMSYYPRSSADAIMVAAIVHGIDITWSVNPMRDWYNLCHNRPLSNEIVNYVLSVNPDAYHVRNTFNPMFPVGFYSNEVMSDMCRNQNIRVGLLADKHEELVYNSMIDTFYSGFQPGLTTLESGLHSTNFKRDPNAVVVCYGSRSTGMTAYDIIELCELFEHNLTYATAKGNDHYTDQAIKKLRWLCERNINSGRESNPGLDYSNSTEYASWVRLMTAIDNVNIIQSQTQEHCKNLLISYNEGSTTRKSVIREVLLDLHDVGMYMRSWKGPPHSLPVALAPPNYNQSEVDDLVTKAAQQMHSTIDQGRIKLQGMDDDWNPCSLLNLPLLEYIQSTSEYVKSTDSEHGLTIMDRLKIVEENKDGYSCIRVSSNWIVASAYRYLSVVGCRPSYNIDNLDRIS